MLEVADSRVYVRALLFGQMRREDQLRTAIGIAALPKPRQQRQQVVLVSLQVKSSMNMWAPIAHEVAQLSSAQLRYHSSAQHRTSRVLMTLGTATHCQPAQRLTRWRRMPGASPPLSASTMSPNRLSAWATQHSISPTRCIIPERASVIYSQQSCRRRSGSWVSDWICRIMQLHESPPQT